MNTFFRESFDKDLSVLTDAGLLRRIRKMIEQVEGARNFQEIPNLKRLEAKGKYFRIRLGDYRAGLVFEQGGHICASPSSPGDLPLFSMKVNFEDERRQGRQLSLAPLNP